MELNEKTKTSAVEIINLMKTAIEALDQVTIITDAVFEENGEHRLFLDTFNNYLREIDKENVILRFEKLINY